MKQEYNRALYDAITGIDDDLIAEAAVPAIRKFHRSMLRIAAVAAVLILAIGLSVWLLPNVISTDATSGPAVLLQPTSGSTAPTPPPFTNSTTLPTVPIVPQPGKLITLSAEDIAAVFEPVPSGTLAISRYMTIYRKELIVEPITYTDYLPIFQKNMLEDCQALLSSFIEEIYPLFSVDANPLYNITEVTAAEAGYTYYTWDAGDGFHFDCMDGWLTAYQRTLDYEPLQFLGKTVRIPSEANDEQIADTLADAIQSINQLSDKSFSLYHILRLNVNAPAIIITLMSGTNPNADRISLDFFMNTDDGNYTLDSIQYTRQIPLELCQPIIGYANMISLETAEQLLAKGYTFGHQTCICGAIISRPEFNFDEYDAVELTWEWSRRGQCIVPFYCFYKQTGYDAYRDQKIYAVTMVPAIEIESLEDYFENLAENHTHYSSTSANRLP